jgi:hypothetical protein
MKRERGGVERERSGITSLCELPEGEIRALGTDEGRDPLWESGICGHENSDNERFDKVQFPHAFLKKKLTGHLLESLIPQQVNSHTSE